VARGDNGVPAPARVVIVIEENHSYSQIIGSASAPYINSLATNGALFTQSYALTHPSQPNYIALFSGSTQGVTNDSVYPHSQFTAANLGANLLASPRGLSFGGYSETMPSVGYDGASAGTAPATYQRKHNPWVNWQDATVPLPPNKLPPSVNMPFAGYFPTDYATLPTVSFVIPNQRNDMHDGTVAQGDAWLQSNLSAYAAWCQSHDGLLIVTFDEDNSSEGNRIVTIFYGPLVVPGQYPEPISHYRVLRTLEDMFGLPHAAGTATAAPITDVWAPCTPTLAAQPSPASACPSGTATFNAAATGPGPFTWQWQIQTSPGIWQTMGNDPGPLPCGGGAYAFAAPINSASVQVAVHPCAGVTHYQIRCVVSNACGSATSDDATLSLLASGSGDGDLSGTTDGNDIQPCVAALINGGAPSAGDCACDMNTNGVLDLADVPLFVTALLRG